MFVLTSWNLGIDGLGGGTIIIGNIRKQGPRTEIQTQSTQRKHLGSGIEQG